MLTEKVLIVFLSSFFFFFFLSSLQVIAMGLMDATSTEAYVVRADALTATGMLYTLQHK